MKSINKLFSLVFSREFIMYIIMGVLTTLVNWVSYWFLIRVIVTGNDLFNMTASNVIAWIISVLFAYITNKIWVFNSKSWKPGFIAGELFKFVGSRILTGCLEWFGLPFLVWIGLNQPALGAKGGVAKIIVSVLVVILNYVFSKLIIFKKSSKGAK